MLNGNNVADKMPWLNMEPSDFCTGCQHLQQELDKREKTFETKFILIKEKIKNAHSLICHYKAKNNKFDEHLKKCEEKSKLVQRMQGECARYENELATLLKKVEPLKKENRALSLELQKQNEAITDLEYKLDASEALCQQYKTFNNEKNSYMKTSAEKCSLLTKEVSSLRTSVSKQEKDLKRSKDEILEKRSLLKEKNKFISRYQRRESRLKKYLLLFANILDEHKILPRNSARILKQVKGELDGFNSSHSEADGKMNEDADDLRLERLLLEDNPSVRREVESIEDILAASKYMVPVLSPIPSPQRMQNIEKDVTQLSRNNLKYNWNNYNEQEGDLSSDFDSNYRIEFSRVPKFSGEVSLSTTTLPSFAEVFLKNNYNVNNNFVKENTNNFISNPTRTLFDNQQNDVQIQNLDEVLISSRNKIVTGTGIHEKDDGNQHNEIQTQVVGALLSGVTENDRIDNTNVQISNVDEKLSSINKITTVAGNHEKDAMPLQVINSHIINESITNNSNQDKSELNNLLVRNIQEDHYYSKIPVSEILNDTLQNHTSSAANSEFCTDMGSEATLPYSLTDPLHLHQVSMSKGTDEVNNGDFSENINSIITPERNEESRLEKVDSHENANDIPAEKECTVFNSQNISSLGERQNIYLRKENNIIFFQKPSDNNNILEETHLISNKNNQPSDSEFSHSLQHINSKSPVNIDGEMRHNLESSQCSKLNLKEIETKKDARYHGHEMEETFNSIHVNGNTRNTLAKSLESENIYFSTDIENENSPRTVVGDKYSGMYIISNSNQTIYSASLCNVEDNTIQTEALDLSLKSEARGVHSNNSFQFKKNNGRILQRPIAQKQTIGFDFSSNNGMNCCKKSIDWKENKCIAFSSKINHSNSTALGLMIQQNESKLSNFNHFESTRNTLSSENSQFHPLQRRFNENTDYKNINSRNKSKNGTLFPANTDSQENVKGRAVNGHQSENTLHDRIIKRVRSKLKNEKQSLKSANDESAINYSESIPSNTENNITKTTMKKSHKVSYKNDKRRESSAFDILKSNGLSKFKICNTERKDIPSTSKNYLQTFLPNVSAVLKDQLNRNLCLSDILFTETELLPFPSSPSMAKHQSKRQKKKQTILIDKQCQKTLELNSYAQSSGIANSETKQEVNTHQLSCNNNVKTNTNKDAESLKDPAQCSSISNEPSLKRKLSQSEDSSNKKQCVENLSEEGIISHEINSSHVKLSVASKILSKCLRSILVKGICKLESFVSQLSKLPSSTFFVDRLLRKLLKIEFDFLPTLLAVSFDNTSDKPFLPDSELTLIKVLISLSQTSKMTDIMSLLVKKLQAAICTSTASTNARSCMCRISIALLRIQGNLEASQIFCYDILYSKVPDSPILLLNIANVWPLTLQMQLSGEIHPFVAVFHLLISRMCLENKEKLEKIWLQLSTLLQFKPSNLNANELATLLFSQIKNKSETDDSSLTNWNFNIVKAIELLADYQGWEWTNDFVLHDLIWPLLVSWRDFQSEKFDEQHIMCSFLLLGYLGKQCTIERQQDTVQVISLLESFFIEAMDNSQKISLPIQLSALEALLMLAPFNPLVANSICQKWFASNKNPPKVILNMYHLYKDVISKPIP